MRTVLVAFLVAVVGLLGCAQRKEQAASRGESLRMDKAVVSDASMAPPAPAEMVARAGAVAQAVEPAGERMIIRTGTIEVRCEDTAVSFARVREIAERHGGFVSDSSATPIREDVLQRTATVRVPAASFEATLDEIRKVGKRLLSESTSSQDVTEEYVDLGARLRNLEATEKELLQILVEVREKAKKASDVLEVYQTIKGVRGEIEQAKGRIQYLERMVGMSTIQVTLTPVLPDQPIVEPEGWSALRTLKNALRTLVAMLQWLADVAIHLLIVVLPVLVLIAIPVYVVVRLVVWAERRRRARKTGASPRPGP